MELHHLHSHIHLLLSPISSTPPSSALAFPFPFLSSPQISSLSLSLHRHRSRLTPFARYVNPYDDTVHPAKEVSEEFSPVDRVLESEEDARRRHWIERFWAPWEEHHSTETQFALDTLRLSRGKEEPLVPPEMFAQLYEKPKPLIPDDWEPKEFPHVTDAIEHGQIPGTAWREPMVFRLIPPRDWPPPGWKVDPDELAFIRQAHASQNRRITLDDLKKAKPNKEEGNFDRYKMFLKQYNEWVAANKERRDREEEELDEEYYPGRRRMGNEYKEGMYELPFIYPGQHYVGEVTYVHLYEGAFVYFGGVHDGWVPIRRNDWYHIRHHIKVGMPVQVEVIAKRDPYRFRFPVEMRFVNPNIDHLIFHRFKHPPIFVRKDEKNMDVVTRDAGRPYWPRRRPHPEDEKKKSILHHPYRFKVWQIHMAEQMVLDEEERRAAGVIVPRPNIHEASGRLYIDKDSYWTIEKIGDLKIPSVFLTQHESELDIEEARKERQAVNKAKEEAELRGEKYEYPKLKRDLYMEELDARHRLRYLDEDEALERDKINRLELGLPLEEPGRYADDSVFGENKYNPREKRWRHDYIGDSPRTRDKRKRGFRPRSSRVVGVAKEQRVQKGSSPIKAGKDLPGIVLKKVSTEETFPGKSTKSREESSSTEKVVNGTESSRVVDTKGMFKLREDQTEDGSDES